MTWLSIIIGLIQLILGRILPAPNSTRSQALANYETERFRELAEAIAAQKPGGRELSRHEVDALATGLPGFLDSIIGLLPKDLLNKAVGCGFAALLLYFQNKDVGAALTQFISCTLSGVVTPPPGGGGGGGTTPPPGGGGGGGGGVDPTRPTLRDVKRCQ